MSTRLTRISSGATSAVLDPEDGARLTSWRVGGHELIVPADDRGELDWGAFPMAPWTSILREDAGHEVTRGEDDGAFPMWHGVARRMPWDVVRAGGSEIVLTTDISRRWKAGGALLLRVSVSPAALHYELTFRAGSTASRIALGWHPWFAAALDGVAARLEVAPTMQVQGRTADGIATRDWMPSNAERDWDDCVIATWPMRVSYGEVGVLSVESSAPFAILFAPQGRGICVEPITSPAEFRHDIVEPGEHLVLSVKCVFESAN